MSPQLKKKKKTHTRTRLACKIATPQLARPGL